jgi:cyclase
MNGFDLELLSEIKIEYRDSNYSVLAVREIFNHIAEVFEKCKLDAVACGSMFVYQGPLKGVLISYPKQAEIIRLNQL